jgi:hypothetical protein
LYRSCTASFGGSSSIEECRIPELTNGTILKRSVAALELLPTELRFLANKPAQSFSNLISHFSKDYELPIRRGSRRVLKALVQPFSATRKYGTRFLCVVADREDVVELLASEFIYRLRAASCDVDSDLRHRRDGIRIEADGTRTRAEYLELIASDMP